MKSGRRRVRVVAEVAATHVGDGGRLREDALANFGQYAVAFLLAGLAEPDGTIPRWIVRRQTLTTHVPATAGESLDIACRTAATSPAACDFEITVAGNHGSYAVIRTLWGCVDRTGRPRLLPETVIDYLGTGPYARGRAQRAGRRPAGCDSDRPTGPWIRRLWVVRPDDIDAWNHVNNAVYLAIAEGNGYPPPPRRTEVDYVSAIPDGTTQVVVRERPTTRGRAVVVGVDGTIHARVWTVRLPALPEKQS